MKRILATALCVLAPFGASASMFVDDTSNSLANLMYIPAAGTLYGKTSVGMAQYEGKEKTANSDIEGDFMTVSQELRWGFSNRLNGFVGLTHQISGEFETTTAGTTTTADVDGTFNPVFGVSYRTGEVSGNMLTSDVFLSYAPDLFDAETDVDGASTALSPSVDGQLLGGDALTLGGRVGRQFKAFQFSLDLAFTRLGENKNENTATNRTTTTDARFATKYGGSVLVPMGEALWLQGSVHNARRSSSETMTAGTRGTVRAERSMIYGLGALWALTPEKVLLGADLNYECIGNRRGGGTKDEDRKVLGLALSARYQF